jgi:hypothetical protein
MTCPYCGKGIKAGFLSPKKMIRCKCGTRIQLAQGFLRPSIKDWEPPEDA